MERAETESILDVDYTTVNQVDKHIFRKCSELCKGIQFDLQFNATGKDGLKREIWEKQTLAVVHQQLRSTISGQN